VVALRQPPKPTDTGTISLNEQLVDLEGQYAIDISPVGSSLWPICVAGSPMTKDTSEGREGMV
jgi:hypothetical protein